MREQSIISKLVPVAILLSSITIIYLLSFNGLYGQDAYEYLRLLRSYNDYFTDGHAMPSSFFPGFYPLISFLVSKICMNDILALQLVSVLSFAGACFYLKKLILLIYNKSDQLTLYIILFFALSPYVFRFTFLDMSDMATTFLILAAIYYAMLFLKLNRLAALVLFALFASFAFYTRYASAVILFPVLSIVIIAIIKQRNYVYFVYPILIFAILSLPDLLIRSRLLIWDLQPGNLQFAYGSLHWNIANLFSRNFYNTDGWQHYTYFNLLAVFENVFHPAFIFCGILFLFFLKRDELSNRFSALLVMSILLYALFVAGFPYQNKRYLLITFPFLIVLFYPSYIRITSKYFNNTTALSIIISLIILLQGSFIVYSSQTIYQANKNEKQIAEAMKGYPKETIYTFSINGALKAYGIQNKIEDIYNRRISSIEKPAVLLFNYNQFSNQFIGLNPMENWNSINNNYAVKKVQDLPDGWAVYRIE